MYSNQFFCTTSQLKKNDLEFELSLDILLEPIKAELGDILDELDELAYPKSILDKAPFLPAINLKCATRAARNYLFQTEFIPSFQPSLQPSSSLQPSASSFPSFKPSISSAPTSTSVPSLVPTKSAAPSEETFKVPFQATIGGFFAAISEGCAPTDGAFSFGGGYNSTKGELAMNIIVELSGSRNLQQALTTLASLLDIPLSTSFFEQLSFLDDIDLGGSLLLDLTIGARINKTEVGGSSYSSPGVFIEINRFLVSAI